MFIRGFAKANQVKVAPQIFRRPVLYMRDRSFFIAKIESANLKYRHKAFGWKGASQELPKRIYRSEDRAEGRWRQCLREQCRYERKGHERKRQHRQREQRSCGWRGCAKEGNARPFSPRSDHHCSPLGCRCSAEAHGCELLELCGHEAELHHRHVLLSDHPCASEHRTVRHHRSPCRAYVPDPDAQRNALGEHRV